MDFNQLSEQTNAIVVALRRASQLTMAVQFSLSGAHAAKDDKSPVTIADFGAQALVSQVLYDRLGSFSMVSEESASFLRSAEQSKMSERVLELVNRHGLERIDRDQLLELIDAGKDAKPTQGFWTLDPIDGTKGFLRGDQYAIALAWIEAEQVQLAGLACPRLDDVSGRGAGSLYIAERGRGAWTAPLVGGGLRPARVSARRDLCEGRICESVERAHSAHGRSAALRERLGVRAEPLRIDSQAKYACVARGDADIYLRLPTRPGYVEKIWDHAAGSLILSEAGGRVSDLEGRALRFDSSGLLEGFRGIIGTNGHLHDEILQALSIQI